MEGLPKTRLDKSDPQFPESESQSKLMERLDSLIAQFQKTEDEVLKNEIRKKFGQLEAISKNNADTYRGKLIELGIIEQE